MTDLSAASTADLVAELDRRRSHHEPMEFLKIVSAVSLHYKIQCDCICSKSRFREYVIPRQVAMYLCAETPLGVTAAGRFFATDHKTVLHAVKQVRRSRQMLAAALKIRKKI